MIIQCINCNKKFEVSSSLIPESGRKIQCGSCNHTWYFRHIDKTIAKKEDIRKKSDDEIIDSIKNKKISLDQNIDEDKEIQIDIKKNTKKNEKSNIAKVSKTASFSKILSYILVSIITLVAIVLLLDTFKSPLSNLFPSLELLLYNLFESIKDMFLFFKNLLG